jgi:hypothetical protein
MKAEVEQVRGALLPVCKALSKLAIRLHEMENSARYRTDGLIDNRPLWTVADIGPRSVWLSGYPQNNALGGAMASVLRVQYRFLTAMVSGDYIARMGLPGTSASGGQVLPGVCAAVSRLTARFGFGLPVTPRELTKCATPRDDITVGEWLPKSPIPKN